MSRCGTKQWRPQQIQLHLHPHRRPAPVPATPSATAPAVKREAPSLGSFMDFMAGMAHLQPKPPPSAPLPTVKSEAERYLELAPEPMTTDVLQWWAENEITFLPRTQCNGAPIFIWVCQQHQLLPSASSVLPGVHLTTSGKGCVNICLKCLCGRASIRRNDRQNELGKARDTTDHIRLFILTIHTSMTSVSLEPLV